MTAPAETFETSLAQEHLWWASKRAAESSTYHNGWAIRVIGRLDRARVETVVAKLALRQPLLRASFPLRDGRPVIAVPETRTIPVLSTDARGLGEPELLERVYEALRTPFDLERGPVFRVHLFELADESVVLFGMHHLIMDGQSLFFLIDEFGRLYEDLDVELPPIREHYGAYASFERRLAGSPDGEPLFDHYQGVIADAEMPLRLPYVANRPPRDPHSHGSEIVFLEVDEKARIEAAAHAAGVSLFSFMLTAYAVLLEKQTGQRDFLIGIATAGRRTPENFFTFGYYSQLVPIRAATASGASFSERARRADAEVRFAKERFFPLAHVVEATGLRLGRGQDQVFQTVFSGQRAPKGTPFFHIDLAGKERPRSVREAILDHHREGSGASFEWHGLRIRPFHFEQNQSVADILVQMANMEDGIAIVFFYDPKIFRDGAIARLADRYRTLVRAAAAAPEASADELEWLPADERDLVSSFGAPPRVPECTGPDLAARFAVTARRFPDRPAATFGDRTLTYAELAREVERAAAALGAHGVRRGDRVLLLLERSLDLVIGILATLEAGAAYVPASPDLPEERLAYLGADARPRLVLGHRSLVDRWRGEAPFLAIEDLVAHAGAAPAPLPQTRDEDAAYVVYTSGSTGAPKGVVVSHRNVRRLFDSTESLFTFDEHDVWTLFHDASFDFSVWELFGALLYGGRLVVVPRDVARDPNAFLDLLARERVTVLNQTPSAFHALDAADGRAGAGPALALRYIVFGGERLVPSRLASWAARHGCDSPALVNMYGITETTVHVTYRRLAARDVAGCGESVVGTPLPDLRVEIVDDRLAPVGIGVTGEILVSGAGVASGYLDRPELDRERFVKRADGTRAYRSGDLGYRAEDGEIVYVGRRDDQVKIRGHRIELGEVSAAVQACEGVAQCCIAVLSDDHGDRLAAYVATKTLGEAELRAFLARHLPAYAIPQRFLLLPSLPLNKNGKIDQVALRDLLEAGDRARAAAPSAARNAIEAAVLAAWADALGHSLAGPDDNFFDVGGDSLRLTRVYQTLIERGLCDPDRVAVADLFGSPTAAGQAALLGAPRGAPRAESERDRRRSRRAARYRGEARI